MSALTAAEAYPLYWPEDRPRTPQWQRSRSKFATTFAVARDQLGRELKLLGAKDIVLSTNVPLRRDGLPLAGQAQPKDPAVAVYFYRKGRQLCFACDRWNKVEDNVWAVCKTIDALRGVARWGTGDMIEAAFRGYAALLPAAEPWHKVLGLDAGATRGTVEAAYRVKLAQAHPDRGGSAQQFQAVQDAYQAALMATAR
jgi:DnaJ domain